MNVSRASSRGIFYCAFNQDYSCITIGTKRGFSLFNQSGDICYERADGAIAIAEMLFCTNLVAVVGAGFQPALSPRRLLLLDTVTGKTLAEASFLWAILAVRMNRRRLVVVMEHKASVHDLRADLAVVSVIDTIPNSKGLVALSPGSDPRSFLALPASESKGHVLIYDALTMETVCQIQAHSSPVVALAFSRDGSLLASASEKGTVIRVHRVPLATKAYTFRRGYQPALIYSLAFGPEGVCPRLLCALSSSGTVHVFKLDTCHECTKAAAALAARAEARPPSLPSLSSLPTASLLNDIVGQALTRVPRTGITKSFLPDDADSPRSFACVRLPSPAMVGVCAIVAPASLGQGLHDRSLEGGARSVVHLDRVRLLMITSEGYFYDYSVELPVNGVQAAEGCKGYNLEQERVLIQSASEEISVRRLG